MRAIILAGGLGTRLKPFTTLIPKPLVPIGGKYSILEIIIKQLAANNFKEITIALNHYSHLIMSYFGNGKKFGVKINYSTEKKPLGTIGPLKIIKNLPENFLVLNGDILTNINFKKYYNLHIKNKKSLSVCTFQRKQKINYGILCQFHLSLYFSREIIRTRPVHRVVHPHSEDKNFINTPPRDFQMYFI